MVLLESNGLESYNLYVIQILMEDPYHESMDQSE